uniref:Uncharacterized protein n=1 Tax=Ursus maritimus TaxID=29073 RepID=A0A452UP41_URSMA
PDRTHHAAVVQDTKLYLDPGPSPFAIAHVVSRGFVTKGQSLMVVKLRRLRTVWAERRLASEPWSRWRATRLGMCSERPAPRVLLG